MKAKWMGYLSFILLAAFALSSCASAPAGQPTTGRKFGDVAGAVACELWQQAKPFYPSVRDLILADPASSATLRKDFTDFDAIAPDVDLSVQALCRKTGDAPLDIADFAPLLIRVSQAVILRSVRVKTP